MGDPTDGYWDSVFKAKIIIYIKKKKKNKKTKVRDKDKTTWSMNF